jgi:PAS domain S-box-containing protein
MPKEITLTKQKVKTNTQHKQTEEQIRRHTAVLAAINKVFRESFKCETDEEIARTFLSYAEELTGSKFGFICEVNQAGCLDTIAISDPGWNACRIPKADAVLMLRDLEVRGIRGRVIKDEGSVIANDPGSHPDWIGFPEGHPRITRFLCVPFKLVSKTMGMIGLANKESDYDLADQEDIETLSVAFVEALSLKRMEMALKELEERFRQVAENAQEWIWEVNADGLYTYASPVVEKMLGYKSEEIVGTKHFYDLFHPEDREALKKSAFEVFANKQSFRELINRNVHKNGKTVWLSTSGVPIVDKKGNFLGYRGTDIDITDRKRTEEQLRLVSLYTRSLIEASLDPLVTISADGKITDVNEATIKATGVPRKNLIGSDFSDYFTEPEKARAGYRKVLTDGLVIDYPLTLQHRFGKTMDVLYNATVYRNEKGEIQGVFAAARDITERKRAEDALSASEIRYRRLFEAAKDGILILDAGTGGIIDANPFLLQMLGYTHEQLLGKKLWDIGLFEDIEACKVAFKKLQTEGYIRYENLGLETTDRKHIDVEFVSNVYWVNHRKVIQCNIRNITERKQIEKTLKKTLDELERSNKELEQFAYVASHDLQEPLRMVASYTQLLEMRYKDKLDSDANDFINYAVDGANRMQRLINDLLVYSRVGTRGKPLEPVDSQSALGQAIVNLEVFISENQAIITNDDLPPVIADSIQLVQLFQNLVDNAIKFRSDKTPYIHVSVKQEGNEWVFSVRDNGIGIAPQYKERIFVIFQRVHSREEYSGTGMGLAICKKIVERHSGRIWVDSKPGEGSTFYFTIPLRGGEKT